MRKDVKDVKDGSSRNKKNRKDVKDGSSRNK
jgi:hypothetical protein